MSILKSFMSYCCSQLDGGDINLFLDDQEGPLGTKLQDVNDMCVNYEKIYRFVL